jgi:hypothetical protein
LAEHEDDRNVYDQCWGQHGIDCPVEVGAADGVSPQGIAFIEQNQQVLVSFQELGRVDFGQVAWLWINMGRQQPVFLNGDFGLIYYGDLIPDDWSSADPSYSSLPDVPAKNHPPWGAASRVAGSYSDQTGEHVVVETLITFCGPCPNLGYLPLDVAFDSRGSLIGVTILPIRCESAVFPQNIVLGEGPCNPPPKPP